MAVAVGCKGELVTYAEDENDHEGHTHPPLSLEDVAPQLRKLCFIPGPTSFVDVDGLNHLKSSQVTTQAKQSLGMTLWRGMGPALLLDKWKRSAMHIISSLISREMRCANRSLTDPIHINMQYIQAHSCWRAFAEEPEIVDVERHSKWDSRGYPGSPFNCYKFILIFNSEDCQNIFIEVAACMRHSIM